MQETSKELEVLKTRCCIAGGGPAGMMLGFLLARAGVDVIVLEKHADFLRDFRGDTIHPSTLEIMYELGLLDEFLRRPHQEFTQLSGQIEDFVVPVAEFSHISTHCKFMALMPQWDFLNFLAEKGKLYPQFHLQMLAEVTGLIEENGLIEGVRASTPHGEIEIRADLVVGADGRHSTVRAKAGLQVVDRGAPMDVLWMRLTRRPEDPRQTLGRFRGGRLLVTLDRGDYWQCAFVIPKGTLAQVQERGLPAFRAELVHVAPFLSDRVDELKSWDEIKLLTVVVDRLRRWSRPGLLCIGDAAHAMSPIGGVGINLAIQDAVAAANILAEPLLRGRANRDLRVVQRRREFPMRVIQGFQVFVQNRVFGQTTNRARTMRKLPLIFRLLQRFPILRRIPASFLGIGVRPEHVRTRDSRSAR